MPSFAANRRRRGTVAGRKPDSAKPTSRPHTEVRRISKTKGAPKLAKVASALRSVRSGVLFSPCAGFEPFALVPVGFASAFLAAFEYSLPALGTNLPRLLAMD